MSCTINNMGGAGSAVPKLRDSFTIDTTGTASQKKTVYTATSDCYVRLCIHGGTSWTSYNDLYINNNNHIGATATGYSGTGYFQLNQSYLTSYPRIISTVTSGTPGSSPKALCYGIVVFMEVGETLSMSVGSGASANSKIEVSVYY